MHTLPPFANESADNGNCSQHGVPMVGLVPPAPHPVTHPQHADQNDDIVDGTAESHSGVPTVGLSAILQKVSSTHSHADIGSKEPVTFPHSHENAALEPASASTSAQCPMQEHAPAENVRSHSSNNCNEVSPSRSHTDCLRPPVSGESDTSHCPFAKEKDASPPKRAKYSKVHPYAIISLF